MAEVDRRPERPPTVVPHTPVRLVPEAASSLEAQLPAEAWTRRRIQEGSRGPVHADFVMRQVVASRNSLLGSDIWVVLRRQPGSEALKVFLCHAPHRVKPARLARLTGPRWAIET